MAPLLSFDSQDVGDGLQTGLAATGSAFSFGLWNGGKWRCHLGYAGAHAIGGIGANAAATVATAGLGEAFAAAKAAQAVQAAGEIGEGAGEVADASGESVNLFHGSTNNYSDIMANGLDTERGGATYTSTSREAAADAINPARRVDPLRDPGIIQSKVPRASFDEMVRSGDIELRQPYHGFFPYTLDTSEYLLRSSAAKALFNSGIVR